MGFADLLLLMEIPYNSDQGVALGEKIMKYINTVGHTASKKLARERGLSRSSKPASMLMMRRFETER